MRALINTTKNTIEEGRKYVYHREQNNEARKLLKIVEAEKGKLDSKNIRLCKEYSKDIFGDEKYAPWLITYSTYQREFKEGWIPDNYYGAVVVPNFNGEYGKICNRNAVISTLLKESDSLDICYYVNHLFLSSSFKVLNEQELKKILFTERKKVVYKIENSRQGKGVYFFDENSFNFATIKKLGNGVFQKYIEQHSFFSEFNKSAVSTIRITSVCDENGNIDVKAGYFRFGRENDTHVMSSSQMRIPIDIKSGKLYHIAYFPNTKSTKQLPDNDLSFAGKELPSFDVCLTEVKKMHSQIPFVRCVGWDIILDKHNEVKLIELNGGHNGITFNEMVQGPCFKGLNWEKLNKIV